MDGFRGQNTLNFEKKNFEMMKRVMLIWLK